MPKTPQVYFISHHVIVVDVLIHKSTTQTGSSEASINPHDQYFRVIKPFALD